MGGEFFKTVETIVILIGTVAIVALIVSPKATSASLIQASGSALGNDLGVAESPVTGSTYQINLSYPNENPWHSSPFYG